jgi:hypothetical protein
MTIALQVSASDPKQTSMARGAELIISCVKARRSKISRQISYALDPDWPIAYFNLCREWSAVCSKAFIGKSLRP